MTNDNTNTTLALFLDFICGFIIHDNGADYCSSRIESFRAWVGEDPEGAIKHLEGNPSLLREIWAACGAGMPTSTRLTDSEIQVSKRRLVDMF